MYQDPALPEYPDWNYGRVWSKTDSFEVRMGALVFAFSAGFFGNINPQELVEQDILVIGFIFAVHGPKF